MSTTDASQQAIESPRDYRTSEGAFVSPLRYASRSGKVWTRVPMRQKLTLAAAAAIIFAGGLAAYGQTQTTMWEYTVVGTPVVGQMEGQLNRLGAQGWELVSVTSPNVNIFIAVLKRPKS